MESFQACLPIAAMITVECCYVGLTTLAKAAFSKGLNPFLFVVYTNALAAILLSPLAFFMDRDKRPPMTWSMLARFFVLALFGITAAQNCVVMGLQYTSVLLSSTMMNLVPAITFILAIIFRLEKVHTRSSSTYAKVLGTLVSVGGAMVVTLYKGPVVRKFWSAMQNLEESDTIVENTIPVKDWIMGSFLFGGACVSMSLWTIMQVETLNKYPAELSIVAITIVLGTIQSAAVTFLVEHNLPIWSIHWDIEVISILYTAVIIGLTTTLQIWCIRKKGPLFVALFKPVNILIAAIAGATFLGDRLHIGSVLGAILIISGFYAVIWGKSKESSILSLSDAVKCVSVDIKQPLLGC